MTASDFTSDAKELDARAGDGIDVRLFWHPTTDTVSVSVFDTTHEQSFELLVDPADVLPSDFHLETLGEKRFGVTLARISRLIAIDPGKTADAPRS